jgi:uncharacterized protein YbjT (DUF2867 family)
MKLSFSPIQTRVKTPYCGSMTTTHTILVLGATGKTGRRLIPHLTARGATVRAASRQPGEGRTRFDWNEPDTFDPALIGADAIYLVPPDLVEDATPMVAPFLDRALRAGVRRVVLLSSMGVEFPNEGPGSGRDRLEQRVKGSGMDWTILRPGGFNQNFSEGFLLPGILHAGAIATATGDGAVAFVDADDIAAVAAAALTEDGHHQATHVVTGPEALTFADAAAIIGKSAGRPIAHRQISAAELTQILCRAGLPANYAAIVVGNQEAIRDGLGARVTDVVERVTGRAAITFATYAERAAAAWKVPAPVHA